MKKLTLAVAATLLMASPVFAAHGDAAAGKGKSMMCGACHGTAGISAVPTYPNLAGQKEAYLAKQLKDFKSGTRNDPTMKGMAAGLSDADIADLAAYYASLK
jgi:cytochrome c553